ncbi:MAG: very short patch repair endonuclease [Actinomycetota bacterium]|nr:very short patch repair endonuclease [Actinomycetota bacterium]
MPGQFFSHATAALLFDAPISDWSMAASLDVAVVFPRTPPRGRGVTGHRVTSVAVSAVSGLPLASAPDVFCQLGAILSGRDLVAVGDSFVTGRRVGGTREPARCQLDDLRMAAVTHRTKRGAARVAWALDRVRSGADSRPQTWLRLLLIDAGLPAELDVEVDVGFGIRLHPDLAFSAWKIAFEYEGDYHRVRAATWRSDIERRELFEAAGWRVIRVTANDVFRDVDGFVARVRRILSIR